MSRAARSLIAGLPPVIAQLVVDESVFRESGE